MVSAFVQVFKSVFGAKRQAQANTTSSGAASSPHSVGSYGRAISKVLSVALQSNNILHNKSLAAVVEARSTLNECFHQIPRSSVVTSTVDSETPAQDNTVALAESETEEDMDLFHVSAVADSMQHSTLSTTTELDDSDSDSAYSADAESNHFGALLVDEESDSEYGDEDISTSQEGSTSDSESDPESPLTSVASDEDEAQKKSDQVLENAIKALSEYADVPLAFRDDSTESEFLPSLLISDVLLMCFA